MLQMYDFIIELGNIILKNGLSLSMLGSLVFLFLRQRKVKKLICKRLPWVMHDSDVANYEARQIRIEQDVRAIKEHLGVQGWDVEKSILSAGGEKNTSISPWVGTSRAGIADEFTHRTIKSLKLQENSYQSRRNKMKTYLSKLSSTKLQALIIASIMNVALLVGYVMDVQDIQSKVDAWMPMANMVVQTILTIAYQWSRASVDKVELKSQATELNDDAGNHYS